MSCLAPGLGFFSLFLSLGKAVATILLGEWMASVVIPALYAEGHLPSLFMCPLSTFSLPDPVMHLHIEDFSNRRSLSTYQHTSGLGVGPGHSHRGPKWLHSCSKPNAANLSPELERKWEHSRVMWLMGRRAGVWTCYLATRTAHSTFYATFLRLREIVLRVESWEELGEALHLRRRKNKKQSESYLALGWWPETNWAILSTKAFSRVN